MSNKYLINGILRKISSVLTEEEFKEVEESFEFRDENIHYGEPLTDDEKKMMDNLSKQITAEDIKKLDNGKTKLNYLSWAQITKALNTALGRENWSMTDLTPDSVTETPNNSGYLVHVTVNLFRGKIIGTMSLPVMDALNQPIMAEPYEYSTKWGNKTVESIDSFNLYKNYQRCFVKNIACITNLGIELYTGEDLPSQDEDGEPKQSKKSQDKTQEPQKKLGKLGKKPTQSNEKPSTPPDEEEEPF